MSRFSQGWRAGGLLFPVSSLPTDFGIGDLGPAARDFALFIHEAALSFWQVLPLGPSSPGLGNSPYSSFSAFAGSELLVSPEELAAEGLLKESDLKDFRLPRGGGVDYEAVTRKKTALLDLAFAKVKDGLLQDPEFTGFLDSNGAWLNDYSLFMALHGFFDGKPWTQWPEDIKFRRPGALTYYGEKLSAEILRLKFGQHRFFKQLGRLKDELGKLGIGLIGDLAFYVNHDSADVWANPALFALDREGESAVLAGVQPDYYSKTGQLWGNPVYLWENHRADAYGWWTSRVRHNLGCYDWVRLDHFRAFAAFWSVPKGEVDAVRGAWRPGPGADLFRAVLKDGGPLNIISEDLGIITPDVTELRKSLDFPGMRVLQFGVGDPTGLSIHCPFRVEPDNAVYSSTHDTDTARGWFSRELTKEGKKALEILTGQKADEDNVSWTMIRLAWFSPAALALATVQDLLGLGSEARLNVPGTPSGNWTWRLDDLKALDEALALRLKTLTQTSGRDNFQHPNLLRY
ncbi:MAG: 4-alpha-glucanotransferase [Deltaproteobacteria bacterium]|jgi:4-alpha-glucanotransferase|nr:4-alpha-glucanotransferase [Deltaproteobacteria bacterium]